LGDKFKNVVPHLKKGTSVLLEGSLKTQKWQSNDGTWNERPILNVSQVYFTNFPKTKDSAVTEGTGKSLSSKSKSNVVVSIDDDSHDEVPF